MRWSDAVYVSLQPNVTDAAIKWRKRLPTLVRADGYHFQHFLLWTSHMRPKKHNEQKSLNYLFSKSLFKAEFVIFRFLKFPRDSLSYNH